MTVAAALLRRAGVLQRRIVALEAELDALRAAPAYVGAVRDQAIAHAFQLLEAGGSSASHAEWERLVQAVATTPDPLDAGLLIQGCAGVSEANNELLCCATAQRRAEATS